MLKPLKKKLYKAFGFHVLSEIPLPEAPLTSEKIDRVDIEITIGDLSSKWAESAAPNTNFIIKESQVMFKISNTAIFLIQDGKNIIVSPFDEFRQDRIRLYLLGSCMGAILLQRKILPIHGSAVVIDGKAYAFVGESGAGKSTLASAFIKKGYPLLTDDVIAISTNHCDNLLVIPSYPQQKLWKESLEEFGMECNHFHPLIDRAAKFAIPVTGFFSDASVPLAGIFELELSENNRIHIKKIERLGKLRTLFNHTYRNFIISPAGLLNWHFSLSTNIANNVEIYQIQRPTSKFTAYELVSLILQTIHREAIT